MGRELGQLAELCVPDADLTPGKRREGKKDGSKSLAVLRKCQKFNGELPIGRVLHFLAGVLPTYPC